jgi:DNA helicase-2/ATP-dependent DNA helicase PcrA
LTEIGTENIIALRSRSLGALSAARTNGTGRTGDRVLARRTSDEDHYHKDVLPDYDSEPQESVDLHQGAIVSHEMFGRGKVIAINGKGDARKAVVQFENYGMKSLMVKYAKLRPA